MPLYEFECQTCNHREEGLRSVINRHNSPHCPECKKKMKLAVSAPAHPVMNPARPVHKPHNL